MKKALVLTAKKPLNLKWLGNLLLLIGCVWMLFFVITLFTTAFEWMGITKDVHIVYHLMGAICCTAIGLAIEHHFTKCYSYETYRSNRASRNNAISLAITCILVLFGFWIATL